MLLKIAKSVWVALTMIVLAISLYGFDGKPNSDIGIFLAWSMLILAFPSSLLVALLFTGASMAAEKLFLVVIPTNYAFIAISWICFFVAGYWQWFMLMPWLWRKLRRSQPVT